jgi:hypothetical protein
MLVRGSSLARDECICAQRLLHRLLVDEPGVLVALTGAWSAATGERTPEALGSGSDHQPREVQTAEGELEIQAAQIRGSYTS